MAKKAKRRGRPPGSKNKTKLSNGKGVAKMEVGQLRTYIDGLEGLLAKKVQQQKQIFEGHLKELSGYVSAKAAGVVRTARTGKRKKPAPKYQSKKNPKLKWTGRGMLPVWMRDEMKGTKLKKDSFLIK
jgi:DNA-binding protein H-NS